MFGALHHVEIWVTDLAAALDSWGWLLEALGYEAHQSWEHGRSWRLGVTYVVVERSPAVVGDRHDRLAPGVNHLAFHAGSRANVDRLTTDGRVHGWSVLFADRHPHAGGPDHYAAYLENAEGFEVELCASAGE